MIASIRGDYAGKFTLGAKADHTMTGTAAVVLPADKQLVSRSELYPVQCHRSVALRSRGSVQ